MLDRSSLRRSLSVVSAALVCCAAQSPLAHADERGVAKRAEALSWFIQAHVPCTKGADRLGVLKSELTLFSATPEETRSALQLVSANADSCDPLKSMSRDLLQLVDNAPEEFSEKLGFSTVLQVKATDEDQASSAGKDDAQNVSSAPVADGPLAPPPRSRGRE